jgi:hypothetical protein
MGIQASGGNASASGKGSGPICPPEPPVRCLPGNEAGVNRAGGSWKDSNGCLVRGFRGLPGGGSLARLLEEHRGVRRWARQA